MFTLISCGIGLVVVGVGVYKIWKSKGSTADKIAKTAEEAAKAAVLAKQAKDAGKEAGYWKK